MEHQTTTTPHHPLPSQMWKIFKNKCSSRHLSELVQCINSTTIFLYSERELCSSVWIFYGATYEFVLSSFELSQFYLNLVVYSGHTSTNSRALLRKNGVKQRTLVIFFVLLAALLPKRATPNQVEPVHLFWPTNATLWCHLFVEVVIRNAELSRIKNVDK